MIRVADVTCHYGLRPILRHVSCDFAPGTRTAVIGPNGVGKSTLLKVIGGVMTPQFGHVEIAGLKRRSTPEVEREIRRRVVYLPDECWFPSERTCRELLMAVGTLYDVPYFRLIDHVERLVALFALDSIADSALGSYSAGQLKKAMLSSALVAEADYVILDEPFSGGLDPAGIQALKQVLKRMTDDKRRTVIFSTPVPEVLDEVADRMLVLRDGTIEGDYQLADLRRTAGKPFAERVQELVFPQSIERIRRYFERDGAENEMATTAR